MCIRDSRSVDGEVQLEDVHPGFAEHAERASIDVGVDQPPQRGRRHPGRTCHPVHLEAGVGQADVGIEARAGGGDRIDRHEHVGTQPVLIAVRGDALFDRSDLPRREQVIRNTIKRAGLWTR